MVLEVIGYIASVFVAASMLMVSIVRLRIVNLAGAILFVLYGALLPSVPIMLTNLFIVAVNILHIRRAASAARSACEYQIAMPDRHSQVRDYIDAHREDIRRHIPHFQEQFLDLTLRHKGQIFVAIHESRMRGVAMWFPLGGVHPDELPNYAGLRTAVQQLQPHQGSAETAFLALDYIDVRYRDLGLGKKLGGVLDGLRSLGIGRVVTVCDETVRRTRKYLRSQGFVPVAVHSGLGVFERLLIPITDASAPETVHESDADRAKIPKSPADGSH